MASCPRKHPSEEELSELDPIRRALRENEDWYRDLVEHSHDLLCIHDLQGNFLSINPAPARLLGYSVEEVLQTPMRDFVAPGFRRQFDEYLKTIARDGKADGMLAVMTRGGERRIWEYHNTLRTEGVAQPIVRGMAHDVTDRLRAEQALHAHNDKLLQNAHEQESMVRELKLFRTLLDHSNDSVEVIDAETLRFVDVNNRLSAQLGYSREELLSMTVLDIAPEASQDSSVRVTEQLRKYGFAILESLHRRKDGTTFPVEVNIKRVQLDREYMVAVARDITERKRAAELLAASENRFRAVYERSPVGICLIDTRTGRFLQVNPKYCELTGRTEEDLLGRDFYSITYPDDLPDSRTNATRLAKNEIPNYELEKRYIRPDGSICWVHIAAVSLHDVASTTPWSIGIVQDITERKRAEEAMRESEARLRLAQEVAKIGMFERDFVTGISRWTPEMEALYGLPAGGFPKTLEAFFEMIHPDDRARVKDLVARSIATGTGQGEWRVIWPDRAIRWITGRWKVLQDGQGRPLRVIGMDFDITERKQAEEQLRHSEERYRSLALATTQVVWTMEAGGEAVNIPIWCGFTGQTPEQAQGNGWLESVHPDDREGTAAAWARAVENGSVYERDHRVRQRDGDYRYLSVRGVPVREKDGSIREWIGTCTDITDRKRAEEALRQSEERLRVALSGSPIKVYNQDRDLRYTWVYNPPTGWTAEDYLGKTDDEVFGPETGARMRTLKQTVLASGESVRQEFSLTARGKHFYCDVSVEPLRDASGNVVGVNCACVDLTHVHQITEELRQAKEKLAEEKLYLEQAIDTELGFEEIIGKSKGLKGVVEQVTRVATSDATVLLLGETGVGKELVARAVHRLSNRKDNTFIKMNCAAIPTGLLESELFGHEKGAFTGAVTKKLGRLELADKGTLFLDEIGEIPVMLQPKLLRVLQDQEFERLGGTQTIKVNFRLIAATNRDLQDSMRKNQFRSDLYYRLSVFPIRVPPLRERREDIPLLVEHFVAKFAQRMNKSITSIPKKTMELLTRWDWPGNVRELENFVERSVILTQSATLNAPLSELQGSASQTQPDSLKDVEREHILRALQYSRGKLSGPGGAAERLGLKRTTLQAKLKQLGINRQSPPSAVN